MKRRAPGALFVLGAAVALLACSRNDSLVLLDLRASGPLGAPVARVRLSASGWTTRVVTGDVGPGGLLVGYYGPGKGGAVSVTAEALDDVNCVLGSGSATVAKLAGGATSEPLKLFIRPQPGCLPDAGMMDAGGDADEDVGGGGDAMEAGTDAPDAGAEGGGDVGADVAGDAGADSAADASGGDTSDGGAGDDGSADVPSAD